MLFRGNARNLSFNYCVDHHHATRNTRGEEFNEISEFPNKFLVIIINSILPVFYSSRLLPPNLPPPLASSSWWHGQPKQMRKTQSISRTASFQYRNYYFYYFASPPPHSKGKLISQTISRVKKERGIWNRSSRKRPYRHHQWNIVMCCKRWICAPLLFWTIFSSCSTSSTTTTTITTISITPCHEWALGNFRHTI